jgi:hypothetical protein
MPRDGARCPTAFVARDRDGTELDVHVLDVTAGHVAVPLWDTDLRFEPDWLTGAGTIADTAVTCVSAEGQVTMHTGYQLPETHLRDLDLLRGILN